MCPTEEGAGGREPTTGKGNLSHVDTRMAEKRRHLRTITHSLLAAVVVAGILVPYLLGYIGEGLLVLGVGILAWLVRRQIRVPGIPWFAPGEVDREPPDRGR